MAIKIQGTSVIQDDRSLVNITSGTLTGALTANGITIPSGRTFLQNNTAYSAQTEYYFGGASDLAWKKIADVSLPTGIFRAASFEIVFTDTHTNYGSSVESVSSVFTVSCRRSSNIQDNLDDAIVTGPYEDIVRVVKTAVGVYEIQVRQLTTFRHNIVRIRCLSTIISTINYPSTLVNGSTTGTIYTVSRDSISEASTNAFDCVDANYLRLGNAVNRASIEYNSNTAVTYTLPDLASNSEFVMTSGNQTISGQKIFTSNVVVSDRIVHNGSGASEPRIEFSPGAMSLFVGSSNVFSIGSSGQASGSAVQSTEDTITPGQLVRLFSGSGVFGWGTDQTLRTAANFDTLRTSGLYRSVSGEPGSPFTAGIIMHLTRFGGAGLGRHTQLGFSTGDGDLLVRSMDGTGDWRPWRRFFTQSTILGTVSQTGGVPTGRVLEEGGNANGRYKRLASGMQECWHSVNAGSGVAQGDGTFANPWRTEGLNWTFPAEFVEVPILSFSARIANTSAAVQNRCFSFGYAGAFTTELVALRAMRSTSTADTSNVSIDMRAVGLWFS